LDDGQPTKEEVEVEEEEGKKKQTNYLKKNNELDDERL
jgi:hypothetical protein|tara:strand:- start:129 stop:242 length:114 start_codon:yes stop_codon:yes gene_type:complete